MESLPIRSVNLGTGENGMHPQFREILDYLRTLPVKLTITSNGHSAAVLTDDELRAFHDVEFSLDYPTEREQDAQRGRGNWALIHDQAARCVGLGVPVTFIAVMMKSNYLRLAEVARVVKRYDAPLRVNVYQSVRSDLYALSYEEYWQGFRALFAETDVIGIGEPLVRARLGADAIIESVEYGAAIEINGVRISFHPAGHILGSAQIRLEYQGEVWVVSGDYKVAPDPTCAAFEPVKCHTFITESTFGLPIYRWLQASSIFDEINAWWRTNQQAGRASVLFGYPVGKAQRLLAGIDSSIGPIYAHGAVEQMNRIYRASGIPLPAAAFVRDAPARTDWSRALILAPLMSKNSPWMRRFGDASTAFASGWITSGNFAGSPTPRPPDTMMSAFERSTPFASDFLISTNLLLFG